MKLAGLISGGKDSIYNLIACVQYGHEISCLANLFPQQTDELNSHMFQTVGHEAVELLAAAMNIPLIRQPLQGQSVDISLHYESNRDRPVEADNRDSEPEYDEIDDLYRLLVTVKEAYPDIQGVAAGAILSNYQRIRVERICGKLGLTCFAYLWQRDQVELLDEMCRNGTITPALIKLATPNLPPRNNLMKTLPELQSRLLELFDEYGMNVCGEGGEYESFVLDSCLQTQSLQVASFTIVDSDCLDPSGEKQHHLTVPYARLGEIQLVPKTTDAIAKDQAKLVRPMINLDCESLTSSTPCPCTTGCPQQDTTPTALTTADLPPQCLPLLVDQLRANVAAVKPTALITRCALFASDLSELFAAYQSFCELIADRLNMALRPVFVMICIPDMKQFGAMNAQYATVFPSVRPPARVCVQSALPHYTLDVTFMTIPPAEGPGSQGVINLSRRTDSLHVEGISTWAPANIGPYSQYWRLNGLFLGAGQIGMFPPTLALHKCVAKQFLQTIKNAIACIQAASDIHQLTAKYHVAQANAMATSGGLSELIVPSFGQFTSLLLAFDERQVLNVINSVLAGHPQSATLSRLQKVETLLTLINTLASVPSHPVRSPTTEFDPIPFPVIDQSRSGANLPFGTLLNTYKETHQKLSPSQRLSEIVQIAAFLHRHSLHEAELKSETNTSPNAFLPPIITVVDSDLTLPDLKKSAGNIDQDSHDYDEEKQMQPFQRANASAAMIFVSGEMLPRAAAFELCSVGLTHHIFKALAERSSGSGLPTALSHLRWIHTDPATQTTSVIFAIFLPQLYLDLVVFQLEPGTSPVAQPVKRIPDALLAQLYDHTNCHPSGLDSVSSQLFVPAANLSSALAQTPEPHTNIYPSSPLFDQLNLDVAKLYTDAYLRLLQHKSKQIGAVSDYLNQNPSLLDPTTTQDNIFQAFEQAGADFFYPRPTQPNTPCLCTVIPQCTQCPICITRANIMSNSNLSIAQIYHTVLANPNLLTDLENPDN